MNESIKKIIRIILNASVEQAFTTLLPTDDDEATLASNNSFITAESKDVFINDFHRIIDVILTDSNENFSKYLINTKTLEVTEKESGKTINLEASDAVDDTDDDDDYEDGSGDEL